MICWMYCSLVNAFVLGSKKTAALKRNGRPWLALYVDIKNSPRTNGDELGSISSSTIY